jgi:hypothetical protein
MMERGAMDFCVTVALGNASSGWCGAGEPVGSKDGSQPLKATTEEVSSSPSSGEVERNLHNRFAKLSLPRAHSKNR